ncbi:MAG: acyl-CoA dehydrogenase family protein [bacterium]
MFEKITALLPDIEAAAGDIEARRQLPHALVAGLKKAGAFRLLIPQTYGGLEAPFADYLKLVQDMAQADASTAWCVNQAAVIATTSLWLPEPQIQTIWKDEDTSVANGPPFSGEIKPSGEGFELSGHWGFSSGCQHATWMMGAARYSEGGWRIAYLKPDQVQFIDNWQTAGLRGTGSFEFTCDQLQLPACQVADAGQPATYDNILTQIPSALLFGCSFAAVALGVAQGALVDVLDIAQGKLPRYASLHLRDDPDVQRFIGKAQARWRSAQAYLTLTVADVFAEVQAEAQITHANRAALRMCSTYVIRECAEVLDLAYKVAGSTGIYQDHTLQRRFQDMHVITQHVQAREAYFALLGRYAISGEYETGPMT